MSYSERLTLTLPASLLLVAKSISRALDPDTGGYESWTLSEDGLTISTDTPCTPEFKAKADYLLANPTILHEVVAADYVARWPDYEPVTLAECELFCPSMIKEPSIEIPPITGAV